MSSGMGNYFGSVTHVPGVGFVETPSSGRLHGEPDVMMISGLSATGEAAVTTRSDTGQVIATGGTFSLGAALGQRVKILGIELPLWAWVLIGAGALGAGWVFFRKFYK